MRLSRYPINTSKESPADAEVISHKLMLRAGLIRRLAAGIYTFLPMGLRAVRKAEAIVRQEMDRAGAFELLMPAVQPAELWQESRRWEQYGPELLRFKDRHDRDFVIGPTHEEVITDIARRELKSYRQLPVNFYQIQMKFRDEIRPRFGIMRGREFLMKDAYSFHADEASLAEGYAAMKAAYIRMFERMGLNFRAVRADTGSIGGTASEEFQVLADSGEDAIAVSDSDDYAANLELAPTPAFDGNRPPATQSLQRVPTPGTRTIAEVCALLGTLRRPLRQDADRRWRRWRRGRAGDPRRSRAQCGESAEGPGRDEPAAHVERNAHTDRHRHRTGISGPGRTQLPRGGGSCRRRPRRLRLRRQ